MTPKEKAVELVNLMFEKIYGGEGLSAKPFIYERAKDCALVAVDLIFEEIKEPILPMGNVPYYEYSPYWTSVKYEIEKLRNH